MKNEEDNAKKELHRGRKTRKPPNPAVVPISKSGLTNAGLRGSIVVRVSTI